MRVAIIHDWLSVMRGAESALEVLCELYPEAALYCLFHDRGKVSGTIEGMNIKTSFVQRLPFVKRHYRWYLPLFPTAIERLDLRKYDLVISSSHCVAKGVVPAPGARHVSYVYTPMRYMWDLYDDYFGKDRAGLLTRMLVPLFRPYLKSWDIRSSRRVDSFVAISEFVADRIRDYYRRDSEVIYPPVSTEKFHLSGRPPQDFYLVVSALVPYKRLDIAVRAFNALGSELRIIGSGPEDKRLRRLANGNVKFLGWQPYEIVARHYADCRALVFPGIEDFGIVPVEAMASGRPVIACGRGGVLETVVPPGGSGIPTGILYKEKSVEGLCEAVLTFERTSGEFDPEALRRHALKFDRQVFKERISAHIEKQLGMSR
jgi:glycosyltransferase involved in cell wall biosynthesis